MNKTKRVVFGKRIMDTHVQVSVENVNIEQVYEIKFLGVTLDSKFSWKSHIKNKNSIAVLCRIKIYSGTKDVVPYLGYCVELWGNVYKSNLKLLYILQKTSNENREHTKFLWSKALKLTDIHNFKVVQILFKTKEKGTSRKYPKTFYWKGTKAIISEVNIISLKIMLALILGADAYPMAWTCGLR